MKWKLTNLFPTLKDWEDNYKKLESMINSASEFKGKLGDFNEFVKYYKLQKELAILMLKVYQYAALTSDLDKKNTENSARVQRMTFLLSKLNQVTAFESPELLSIGKEKIDSFIKRDETLKEYRFSLANAACLAGIGLSNSIAGIVHSLGHAVGGLCGVPHGVAMSIFLPYGLEYNYDKVKEYLAELLLPLTGPEVYVDTSSGNRALATISFIRELRNELYKLTELPRTLSEAGVSRDKLEEIARIAIDDGSVAFNPVELEYEDALKILKFAY